VNERNPCSGRKIRHQSPQSLDQTKWEGYDADTLLGQISCPVLLLHGEWQRGSTLKSPDADRVAAHLHNGNVRGIKGVGHNPHLDATEEFIQHVTEFFQMFKINAP